MGRPLMEIRLHQAKVFMVIGIVLGVIALGLIGAGIALSLVVMAIIGTHCVMCHSEHPSHEGFDAPPKGVVLGSLDDLRRHSVEVMAQAVRADTMPLGNETGITDVERLKLGAWLTSH